MVNCPSCMREGLFSTNFPPCPRVNFTVSYETAPDCRKIHGFHQANPCIFVSSGNKNTSIRCNMSCFPSRHFHMASFFRFIAANLSLTHFVTWDRPRCSVYRMPCFSFASANTRSIFSFRNLYSAWYCGVCRASSASSIYFCHTCCVYIFVQFALFVHICRVGHVLHI